MSANTAEILGELDNRFYRRVAPSFSHTREYPWQGWNRVYDELALRGAAGSALEVFDVACGNMRFERFAVEKCPQTKIRFHAVDSCDELVVPCEGTEFEHQDIVSELFDETNEGPLFGEAIYDAVVCFGFMHHVYSQKLRQKLVWSLVQAVKPGGFAAISFWEFAHDESSAEKARTTTTRALCELGIEGLEEGDYLLGWNDEPGIYRYCHSFTSAEVDQILNDIPNMASVERYHADGKDGRSNEYALIRIA